LLVLWPTIFMIPNWACAFVMINNNTAVSIPFDMALV